jgi:polyhydroxybutyrate depolymerase
MESNSPDLPAATEIPHARKGTICFTIIVSLIGFSNLALIVITPVKLFERGPRTVVYVVLNAVLGIILALVGIFLWIRQSKGKIASKKYLKILFICLILGGTYQVINNYRTHQQYQHITVAGVERQYLITVPTSYRSDQAVPLVLALHGGSGNANQFKKDSGFDAVAEEHGFIVVYPDGLGSFKYSLHVWNSGTISLGQEMGTDDVGFIIALISHLAAIFTINASRIYITGHSNGAMMTYRMAAEHPELFAAAAPVAGSVGGKETPESALYHIPTPTQAVSIVHVHGRQDQNVLYNGGYSESGFEVGVRYDLAANESVSFWVDANGCQRPAMVSNSANGKITMEKYINGKNNTEVVFVTFNEQNHFWENMDAEVQTEQFNGSSLADMIWTLMEGYIRA